MAYLASHRGDYLAGHQGGLPILGAIGGGLVGKALGWVGRRIGKGALGKGVAAGVAAHAVTGRVLPPVSRIGVPMPGGGTFRPGAIVPGGMPAFTPGPEAIPRGHRLNKTGYHLKDGTYIPPGTKVVKIRRRNFANGKALNRAISRTAGFNRMVKRSRKELRKLSTI